ncbi:MAG: thiamine pyrophosphate-binding protein [Amaricoccus sp.]
MARTAARVLVDCLLAQGVTTAFGVPGESYLAVIDALHDVQDRIRLVPNRHEGGAAFMAEAWGKLTGRPGIALVTRGPGATNAAIGVHTAMQDSSPMILFVGQVGRGMRGREAFQEIDYRAAFGPLAKWAVEIDDPDRVPELVGRAFAVAQSGRPGPVVVALPEDMLVAPCPAEPGPALRIPQAAPTPDAIGELQTRLAAARAPLVLVGGSGWSRGARAGLRAFAEANRLPVVTAWRRTDLIDSASPSFVGIGGLGKPAYLRALIESADLILGIGLRFGEVTTDGYEFPSSRQTLIHVHASDAELNRIFPADLPIQAHPNALIAALDGLQVASDAWAARTRAARAACLADVATPAQPGGLDMGIVVRTLQAVLPQDAILTNGAGNFAIWTNRHFRFTGDQRLLAPQSGAMGYGLPAAVAARIARPDATVVCLAGDGDFQMTAPELGTAMQAGAQPIVLVVNNGLYGTIRMHQERRYPGRASFTALANPDFVQLARAYGFHAERVAASADFPAAFARARASATGALLDLVVSPESLTPQLTLSALAAATQKG